MVAIIKTKIDWNPKELRRQLKKANITNLGRAGFLIRREARKKLRKKHLSKKKKIIDGKTFLVKLPSRPGEAPRGSGGNHSLRASIRFEVSKQKDDVIIGPDAGVVDQVGEAHEFGGKYEGEDYPKRPFMGPSLDIIKGKLPKIWASSVKS